MLVHTYKTPNSDSPVIKTLKSFQRRWCKVSELLPTSFVYKRTVIDPNEQTEVGCCRSGWELWISTDNEVLLAWRWGLTDQGYLTFIAGHENIQTNLFALDDDINVKAGWRTGFQMQAELTLLIIQLRWQEGVLELAKFQRH